jgi:redox-sensing transcriptional repressor
LRIIKQIRDEGFDYISGTAIARELNLEPIQVRKDLAITGIMGIPKRGFPVLPLIVAIERFLGWNLKRTAFIIGAGNLATALTGYQEFKFHGLDFLAAFDTDRMKIGSEIHGVHVYALDDLPRVAEEMNVQIAVLTVPSACAQQTADICVQNNIKAIWNFTKAKIKTPNDVVIQHEDLSSGFALLSVMMNSLNPARTKE